MVELVGPVFVISIDSNEVLKDASKVQYLASSLTGDAKASTQQFPFVASSYSTIITYLRTTYGDPVKLRTIYSNAITTMTADKTIEGMRKNLDNLVAYLQHLKTFDNSQTLEHYLGHILSKFTDEVRDSAYLYLEVTNTETTMKKVLQALDKVLKLKEKIASLIRTIPSQTQSQSAATNSNVVLLTTTPGQTSSNPRKCKAKECIFCRQMHLSQNCRQVVDFEGRSRILSQQGLCWLCLNVGHTKRACPQPSTCLHCKTGDHNVVICYEYLKTLNPDSRTPAKTSRPSSSSTSKQPRGKGILLHTFSCYISHGQKYHELSGIFDSYAHPI